jgi:hypothetical protein
MTQHRFYGLRGEAYGLLKVKILEEESEAIAAYFNEIKNRTGKFTPKDFGAIAMHFRIPLTVMDDLLNKIVGFPVGTWDRLKDKGCKAKDIGVVWNNG